MQMGDDEERFEQQNFVVKMVKIDEDKMIR